MSRVATNYPTTHYNNGVRQSSTSLLSRSSSNASNTNSIGNGGVTVRSAAPPPAQKETVHACPICNSEYKDPRVLPCTHTYCLTCIRDKLINNNRVTCPKCHHEVEPFDEDELNDLPRNLILSQQWRLNARPISSIPPPKKPVTYQPVISNPPQMPKQQENRKSSKSSITETNGHHSSSIASGFAALVNSFSKSSGGGNGSRSSRASSAASTQPMVTNLIKIYSEATAPKQKSDEVSKVPQQTTNQPKRPSQAREEAYEEITWDNLVHGTPVAPPFPEQWQTATEQHHHPPQAPERPISASSSEHHSNTDNLHDIIAAINQNSHEKPSALFPPGALQNAQSNSRPSTASRSQFDPDEDEENDDPPTPTKQPMYATIQPRQRSRQSSNADSIESSSSTPPSRRSPVLSVQNNYQKRSSVTPTRQQQQQQQNNKIPNRPPSVASSKRSSEHFPPPPQSFESPDSNGYRLAKPLSSSLKSNRSSIYHDAPEPMTTNETHHLSTEHFNPDVDIPILPPLQPNTFARVLSQASSSSTSIASNRPPSKSVEREAHYIVPTPPATVTTAVKSRVDLLLSDQKRLEREIEEQMKRLKFDYDDIRKQIDRKESSIHNEIKNISSHLNDDITEHYHRKQKIYANLAADNNLVGNELQRLKTSTNSVDNNKQQLWAILEQIELNIRNIRQAVAQQKELRSSLTFAEGHRTIGADTIGQINFNQIESHQRYNSPPLSHSIPQTSTNITPYKYVKIDHLATLEPESIAITDNNKRILLGICNKLFILDDNGGTIRIIPLAPSIRGIAISKKTQLQNIAYISHDETVSMIDIDSGKCLDCVKETDSTGETSTFLPLGIDTDQIHGNVYVCDYRNSCVIKFDDKLEFLTQWRVYNHSDQYDEARPKLISVYGQKLYMIVEHSSKPYYNQGIAYTFSLHICDTNSGNIIKIIDANLLATQRLRWPCSVQAINNDKCYILDTMTSGKYFNGQWQKHWSRVLEIGQNDSNVVTELFQLDSEAATMAMTKQNMIIAANGDILFVDLNFLKQHQNTSDHAYQNLP